MNQSWTLANLSPTAFENLINSIILKVLGSGSTDFGPGSDLGRDGYFHGMAPYPSESEQWNGTWFIQSKFHAPHLSKDAQKWLLQQIKLEIEEFNKDNSKRTWPDYWIIATNVNISACENGTFDTSKAMVEEARPELKDRFHIWGGEKICNFISFYSDIQKRYSHFLTPGHIISKLYDALDENQLPSVEEIVGSFVLDGIKEQKYMKIDQAGAKEDYRPGIESLFVDLPYVDGNTWSNHLIESLFKTSEESHILERKKFDKYWFDWYKNPERASIWFIKAGPGRGKSSIGQFFSQVHRAAIILSDDGSLNIHPEHITIARSIEKVAKKMGVWPSRHRIPIWVDLKSYAAWFGEQSSMDPKGVATYISLKIKEKTEQEITVKTFKKALEKQSWIIFFDGLDEVPSDLKSELASKVISFIQGSVTKSDLLSVCTSRPQGYSGQFDDLKGATIQLIDLPPHLALTCASKVSSINRSTEEKKKAEDILKRALMSASIRELMVTPLQSHIMAVLVRNGKTPPDKKWELYNSFYEVLREREANRYLIDENLRLILQKQHNIIDGVHHKLGYELHSLSNTAKGAEASLTREKFKEIIEKVVETYGDEEDIEKQINTVLQASTERLVLISTPHDGNKVSFDIRAIQEFFASEYIYLDKNSDQIRSFLKKIIDSPHWWEVVQFLLSALVTKKRATERTIAFEVLSWVDSGKSNSEQRFFYRRLALGAIHAVSIISNGVTEDLKSTRETLRDRLDPISELFDRRTIEELFNPSGKSSKKWLVKWATQTISNKSTGNYFGAIFSLIHMYKVGESDYIFDHLTILFSRVPTAVLLFVLEEYRYDTNEKIVSVIAKVISVLINREDFFSEAPNLFWIILSYKKAILELDSSIKIDCTVLDILNSFEISEEEISPVTIKSVIPTEKFYSDYSISNKDFTDKSFLLRWIFDIYQINDNLNTPEYFEILIKLGKEWTPLINLPNEIRENIPIPKYLRYYTPRDILGILIHKKKQNLTTMFRDAEILIGGESIWSLSWGKKGLIDAFDTINQKYERAAFILLCASISDNDPRSSNETDVPSNTLLTIYKNLKNQPKLLSEIDPRIVLLIIEALENSDFSIKEFIIQHDVNWSFYINDNGYQFTKPLNIALPAETKILIPFATTLMSMICSNILRDPRSAYREENNLTIPEVISSSLEYDQLNSFFSSSCECIHTKTSALFISALYNIEGFDNLINNKSVLFDCIEQKIPVVLGTALIIEFHGLSNSSKAKQLISELLEKRQSVNYTDFDEMKNLDLVFEKWRQK